MLARTIAAGLLFSLAAAPVCAQPQETPARLVQVDAKIVLAVDASHSMDRAEFSVERDGYVQALRHPDLIRAIAAGRLGRVALAYFEWSDRARDGGLVPWRIVATAADAARLADAIVALPTSQSRGTSISRALAFATALIADDPITAERSVIDVSGDGVNNLGPPVIVARDEAVARGITINGLPVLASGNDSVFPDLDRYYEECVIGGSGAFVLPVRTDEEMARTIARKLILEVSGLRTAYRPIPAGYEPIDCEIGERLYNGP